MSDLTEILKKATPEQIKKANACKTADELLSFAKTERIDITAEQAEEFFTMLNPPCGELSDEEMDNVAGGENKILHRAKCPICNGPTYFTSDNEPHYTGTQVFACKSCTNWISVQFQNDVIVQVRPWNK